MTNIQLPDVGVTMALVATLQASLPDFGRIVDQFGHPAPALRKLRWRATAAKHSSWRRSI